MVTKSKVQSSLGGNTGHLQLSPRNIGFRDWGLDNKKLNLTIVSVTPYAIRISRSSLDRLLDPDNVSVTLLTLETVALALGKRLRVQFN